MGVAFIRGAQRHTLASAKHFAVNSIEDTRLVVDVSVDERTLREMYLPHFRMAVEQGHVASVMAAYNMVNGHFNTENFHLLRDVLKGQWRFQGSRSSPTGSSPRTAPPCRPWPASTSRCRCRVLRRATPVRHRGRRSGADLGDRRRRAPRAAREFCFRLDSDPPAPDPTRIETPAHLDLALDAAR
jgi:beta-glucosidase